MKRSLKVVILAAGEGVRMKSRIPKVLHPVCGLPLLGHVLKRAKEMDPEEIFVVVGHQADDVRKAFEEEKVTWILQKEQLGTAHALLQCRDALQNFEGDILLLYGDMILVTQETLGSLLNTHRQKNSACTLLTAILDKQSDFGRIQRDENGRFQKIVEYAEATPALRENPEVNTGFYCFQSPLVFDFLQKLGCNNSKGEYYLTDLPEILLSQGYPVETESTE